MWCLVNHTKKHVVSADLFDIGRQLSYLISMSRWSLTDHIDIEDRKPGVVYDDGYTYDM